MQRKVSKTNRRDENPAATSVKMQVELLAKCTRQYVQHAAVPHAFLLFRATIVLFTAATALQR